MFTYLLKLKTAIRNIKIYQINPYQKILISA